MHVPYSQLADAELRMRKVYPEAISVRAIWTPSAESEIHVEVWERCERAGLPRANVVPA